MKPYWQKDGVTIYHGDCVDVMRALPDASVDCVITDPPYPCIKRDYGTLTEEQWHEMMRALVPEVRRILTPTGSAVFILQPNSERVGRMRLWLWEFMVWVGKEWGIVQDVYWWNHATMPLCGGSERGLLRQSLKSCVWCGAAECFRSQNRVLWDETLGNIALRASARCGRRYYPSGHSRDEKAISLAAATRGGVTPFNVLPIANTNNTSSSGAHGHPAGTPLALCDWWVRYICPTGGGTVLDPFFGAGTVGRAAIRRGCRAIGIEQHEHYCETAARLLQEELERVQPRLPLEPAPARHEKTKQPALWEETC